MSFKSSFKSASTVILSLATDSLIFSLSCEIWDFKHTFLWCTQERRSFISGLCNAEYGVWLLRCVRSSSLGNQEVIIQRDLRCLVQTEHLPYFIPESRIILQSTWNIDRAIRATTDFHYVYRIVSTSLSICIHIKHIY